ncbi:MAG TPA: nucleotidyltransferase domain-containing protein [Bryobacteraceae bacterium]|nr:nucleotidyltransferase domain-containing protein [Bryobacteraceae bacterium]
MATQEQNSTHLEILQGKLNREWPAIYKARDSSEIRRRELADAFADLKSGDSTLVVFGSVARQEVTGGSDLDWVLLIDGQSMAEHNGQEKRISEILAEHRFIEPGRSGVFGKMVGSHDLIHNIGGEDDSNSNTTRRVLLLLESTPVGNAEAWKRVRRQILRRYLEDDRGLLFAGGDVRLPRFLLNDLTRYWRTITVDFVYKQRADNDRKWALRNAKLRMSRKMLYATGLLHCFNCHLDPGAEQARQSLRAETPDSSALLVYLEGQLLMPPLEILAKACLAPGVKTDTACKIFDSYDRFLAILDDTEKREELTRASSHADLRASTAWDEVRNVSAPFHEGLVNLFLNDDERLRALAMRYGIF